MAVNSIVTIIADGATTDFAFSFTGGYMDVAHIFVRVADEVDGALDPVYRDFTLLTAGTLRVLGDTPLNGDEVKIFRATPIIDPVNDFVNGTVLDADTLDRGFEQLLKASQELQDGLADAVSAEEAAIQAAASAAEALGYTAVAQTSADDAVVAELAAEASETAAAISANTASGHSDDASGFSDDAAAEVVLAAAEKTAASGFADDAAADAVLTAADVVTTTADTVLTAADVVLTAADVVTATAQAAAALASAGTAADEASDAAADAVLADASAIAAAASETAASGHADDAEAAAVGFEQHVAAWVHFDNSGSIRIEENVSSVTDNGTGDYTVNFTNKILSTDKDHVGFFASAKRAFSAGSGYVVCTPHEGTYATTFVGDSAGITNMRVNVVDMAGTLVDAVSVHVMILI